MQLDDEIILNYVAGTATEEEVWAVDTAMAVDSVLFNHVRSLLYLRDHFEELWADFSLGDVAQRTRHARLVAATVAASGKNPALAGRLHGWLQESGAVPAETFRVLVDHARRVAGIAAESLSQALVPILQLGFGGIGSPDRALEQHLRQGSKSLEEDDVGGAASELEAAARIDPRAAQNACLRVEQDGRTMLEIRANAVRGTVEVKFWPQPGRPPPQAVLLIPDHEPEAAIVATFDPVEGESSWLAEFLRVPSGAARIFLVK